MSPSKIRVYQILALRKQEEQAGGEMVTSARCAGYGAIGIAPLPPGTLLAETEAKEGAGLRAGSNGGCLAGSSGVGYCPG